MTTRVSLQFLHVLVCCALVSFTGAVEAWSKNKDEKNLTVPLVVVSIRPLGFLVQDICKSECQIQALIPLGQSEHHWEPGPREIAGAKSAVAVVGIGLGLDEMWFSKVSQKGKDSKKIEPILLGKNLEPLSWRSGDKSKTDNHTEEDHDHEHGNFDPHVWFDPVRMSLAVPYIVKGLAQAIPQSAKQLESNGAEVQKKLAALDVDITKLRAGWRDEPVVVAHDALGYWAKRYQLKTVSMTGAGGSGHDISAKVMAKTINEFKKNPPLAIIVERPDGPTKNLAREIKTPIVVLDFAAGADKQSYYDWLLALAHSWDGFAKAAPLGKK